MNDNHSLLGTHWYSGTFSWHPIQLIGGIKDTLAVSVEKTNLSATLLTAVYSIPGTDPHAILLLTAPMYSYQTWRRIRLLWGNLESQWKMDISGKRAKENGDTMREREDNCGQRTRWSISSGETWPKYVW